MTISKELNLGGKFLFQKIFGEVYKIKEGFVTGCRFCCYVLCVCVIAAATSAVEKTCGISPFSIFVRDSEDNCRIRGIPHLSAKADMLSCDLKNIYVYE